jgi:hypothetical protein
MPEGGTLRMTEPAKRFSGKQQESRTHQQL